jgi:hypothetical protein
MVTPHYYSQLGAPQEHLRRDDQNEIITYDTSKDAQAAIDEMDYGIYLLDNNEYSRPDYKIVDLDNQVLDTDDCLVADGTELDGYKPVTADQVPEKIREALLAANVEYKSSEDTYDVYSAYEGDYAIIYCPRTVALELHSDDLGNLLWDHEAFAISEDAE